MKIFLDVAVTVVSATMVLGLALGGPFLKMLASPRGF
jgi:hypothetical protein